MTSLALRRTTLTSAAAVDTELRCRERFPDGDCARPATHVAGAHIDQPGAGYPLCERCAEFWAEENRRELTEEDRARLVEVWAGEPIEGPSRIVKLTPAHRRHALIAAPNGDLLVAPSWLERVSNLLAEPDPGPTPWLVGELLVAGCVGAVQGPPKTGKTWAILELALAIVTGRPAFDRFDVPTSGPVVLVLEESGRAALHRRLGALCRGKAIRPDELADLHYVANRRVRLDDLEWQKALAEVVTTIRPVAVFLDPLARMKAPGRDENAQGDMAELLDFLRYLRDVIEPAPAVVFCHHEGHAGGHLRGSSDLESFWESKIKLSRKDELHTISAEHREAEASAAHTFRQAWDETTRSLRLRLVEDERRDELDEQVGAHLRLYPDASGNDIHKALGGRKADVLKAIQRVRPQVVPDLWEPPGTTTIGTPATGSAERAPLRIRGLDGNRQEQVVPDDPEPAEVEEAR